MTDKNLPPVELLRKLLRYDPETGALFWRERSPSDFFGAGPVPADVVCRRWNTRLCGKRADSVSGNGYRQVNISTPDGKRCLIAHRVIWAITFGSWPTLPLDHINGVRGDNRLENLRASTPSQNSRNAARRSDRRMPCAGVRWNGSSWTAQISIGGARTHLGSFPCLFDAVLARLTAEKAHGYSMRHGL
jgi:hypothetical protein